MGTAWEYYFSQYSDAKMILLERVWRGLVVEQEPQVGSHRSNAGAWNRLSIRALPNYRVHAEHLIQELQKKGITI